jgi:O-antigen/teichoic acid export membrane protein
LSNNLKKKLIAGVAWNLVDKLLTQVGFLAVTLYIAKLIGPESFGLVGMLTLFILLAESVVSNGFSQALVQRSQKLTENDFSTIFYINFLWGSSIYGLLFITAPLIAEFYNQPQLVPIARVLFVIIIINSLTVVVRAQLLIRVDFKSQTVSSAAATIVSSALAVYLALHGYDYWAFVWLLLSRALVLNIFLWLFTRWWPKLIFSKESFLSLFKFGSNLMLAGMVATIVNNLYVAMIGRYFNAASVGYFTQATSLTNFLSGFISSSLQGVTYPILTSIQEDRDRLVSLYQKLIAITMLASLPALVGFAAVADSFVRVFLGDEWLPAVPIIQILCFARVITPISAINMNILNAVGRSDLFLKVDLSKLPMTLAALFISVPLGIQAVAWAMLITSCLAYFINAYYPGKLFGFGAIDQFKVAWKYILSASIMFGVVHSISFDNDLLELLADIFIGGAVYITLLLILKDAMAILVLYEMRKKLKLV